MIAVLLVALFAVAALGGVAVLADSAVRGRNAFRQLRGQLARLEGEPRIGVAFIECQPEPALPALRSRAVSAPRQARRPVRTPAPIRHAAA